MIELLPIPLKLSKPFIPKMLWQIREDNSNAVILQIPINYNNHTSIFYQTAHNKPLIGNFSGMILNPSKYALDTLRSKEFRDFYHTLYNPIRFKPKRLL